MKPIYITKEKEQSILESFLQKFNKEWESFKENMNDTKFSFSVDLSETAKEKVTVLYSPAAYLRMKALVKHFDTEVSWYGLADKINDKLYYVYGVKVCKQYVDGAKVDTEDEDTLAFFDSLTDDEADHLRFQAHSHVKMGTGASSVDLQNQTDVIKNIGKTGFYIFQIWNKQGDINTYLYDLDNNVFYDKKDINLEIEDPDEGTLSEFIDSVKELVQKKVVYYPTTYYEYGKNNKKESPYEEWKKYTNYEGWEYN